MNMLILAAVIGAQSIGQNPAATDNKAQIQINRPATQNQAQNPATAKPPPAAQLPLPRLIQPDATPPASPDGIQVQTSGPIHEAFAQPIDKNPVPTVTVPKPPPPAVPELPPSEKPEGANVQWVPGYWAWDVEKKDYMWVSGVWRNTPPDRKWEPGYWNKVADGWQWVQGYWGSGKVAKPQYMPQPPNSLEEGPSSPSPNENYFYIPGAWVMKDGQYVWRPGFWYPAQQDWTYVPPYYSYTPAGPVYVDGYWDYPFANRGTLFCPVTFDQPFWNNPGWCYQPNFAWDFGIGGPWNCLFVGPGFGHFFCGNFFSPFFFRNGFRPWYAFGARNFDPLFAHASWANRFNAGWMNGLHNNFWARMNNPALRPPNTLAQANALSARGALPAGSPTGRAFNGQGGGRFGVAGNGQRGFGNTAGNTGNALGSSGFGQRGPASGNAGQLAGGGSGTLGQRGPGNGAGQRGPASGNTGQLAGGGPGALNGQRGPGSTAGNGNGAGQSGSTSGNAGQLAGGGRGALTGNVAQANAARQLQSSSAARAAAERSATPTGAFSATAAGGRSNISAASAISGGSARISNGGASTASLSRTGIASTSGIGQATFNATSRGLSSTAATSSLASRGSMNYQSFYSGPSRTVPTSLYQARAARPQDNFANNFGNNSNFGGQNFRGNSMGQMSGINNGRSFGQSMGAMNARNFSGASPSMSSFSRNMGYSGMSGARMGPSSYSGMGGMHMGPSMGGHVGGGSGGHVGGGGGGHGGGGGGHGGGGHR